MIQMTFDLIFRPLVFGNVDHQTLPHKRTAINIPQEGCLIADPDDAAIACDHAIFLVKRLTALIDDLNTCKHALTILWMQSFAPEFWITQPLLLSVAQEGFDLRADVSCGTYIAGRVDVHYDRELFN